MSRVQCGSIFQLRQWYWYMWLFGIWDRETDTFLTELFLLSLLTLQQKLQIALQGVVHLISSSHVNTTLILTIKWQKVQCLVFCILLVKFLFALQQTPVCTNAVNLISPHSSKHSLRFPKHSFLPVQWGVYS